MAVTSHPRWIRTTQGGKMLCFIYTPGSALRTQGFKVENFNLTPEWSRIHLDASRIAKAKFGDQVEISRTRTRS